MLKYLVMLAVVFGLAVFIARQDERATQDAAQKADHKDKPILSAKADENHPQENVADPERDGPSWYGFFRWPTGTTTWAIILTLMAIAWQSNETKKAARATQDSAVAVEKQTRELRRQNRNMVAKERARIAMAFPDDSDSMVILPDQEIYLGSFRLSLKNMGGTPALNIVAQYDTFGSEAEVAPKSENLYLLPSPDHIEGNSFDITSPLSINRRFSEAVAPTIFYVYLRGLIEYNDIFKAKRNSTKFLLRRQFMRGGKNEAVSNVFWEKIGDPEENEST
jgi:hypothetical protein